MARTSGSEKLTLTAFRAIRTLILTQGLREGDLLPTEQSLANSLGVSRSVVREAIKSMELMGMVEAVPGRGTMVCAFSLDFILQNVLFFHVEDNDVSVHEMFSIRRALELSFMRQAFQSITKEDIAQMRRIVEQIRTAWESEGLFAELDRQFHMTLYHAMGNSVFNSLMDAIWSVDMRFQLDLKSPHLESSVAKHEAIVTALETYDYMAFARAMQMHFSSGKYRGDDTYTEAT